MPTNFEIMRGRRSIRRGFVLSFNAATWKAFVTLDGSLSAVELPVGQWVAARLTEGTKVAVLHFDEANPAEGVIVGPYGGTDGDVYPVDDRRGLARRMIWPLGVYTDHFRTGVLTTGYTWAAASGVINGDPNAATNLSLYGEWAALVGSGAGHRNYLQKAVANSGAAWAGKVFLARIRAGGGAECGIRLDNGNSASNQPYLEFFSDATALDGTHTLKIRRVDTVGGATTTTTTQAKKTLDTAFNLYLDCITAAGSYYLRCLLQSEDSQVSLLLQTPALGWIPSAGRVGLYVKESYFYSMIDVFYTSF